MKAITIKQPWAKLIAQGIKDIENRTWPTKFRGKVLIHTSAKSVDVLFSVEQSAQLWMNGYDATVVFSKDTFPTSAIIGEVEIVDCVINHKSIWAEKSTEGEKPIYNWILANAVLYEKPILNVKGKLSFWESEIDIMECIGCSGKFDREEMEEDNANEKYCKECWQVLSPIMAQEAKENRENEF